MLPTRLLVEDVMPFVVDEVAGVPTPVAQRELLEAAADFLTRVDLVVETVSTPVPGIGEHATQFVLPTGMRIARVVELGYGLPGDRRRLRGASREAVLSRTTWEGPAAPLYASVTPTGGVIFSPAFGTTTPAAITAVVTLTTDPETAQDVPGELRQYVDALGAATKARLARMRGVSWTDPDLAADCYSRYSEVVSRLRRDAETVLGAAGEARVVPPRW